MRSNIKAQLGGGVVTTGRSQPCGTTQFASAACFALICVDIQGRQEHHIVIHAVGQYTSHVLARDTRKVVHTSHAPLIGAVTLQPPSHPPPLKKTKTSAETGPVVGWRASLGPA